MSSEREIVLVWNGPGYYGLKYWYDAELYTLTPIEDAAAMRIDVQKPPWCREVLSLRRPLKAYLSKRIIADISIGTQTTFTHKGREVNVAALKVPRKDYPAYKRASLVLAWQYPAAWAKLHLAAFMPLDRVQEINLCFAWVTGGVKRNAVRK